MSFWSAVVTFPTIPLSIALISCSKTTGNTILIVVVIHDRQMSSTIFCLIMMVTIIFARSRDRCKSMYGVSPPDPSVAEPLPTDNTGYQIEKWNFERFNRLHSNFVYRLLVSSFWSWCAFIFLNSSSKTTRLGPPRPDRWENEEKENKNKFSLASSEKDRFYEIYAKIAWL